MSAINERVSPKRLAEIIARAEVCDDSVLTDYRDIESIARELQQYRAAADPIYQVRFSLGWRDVTKAQYDDHEAHGAPVRIVYAAPQVTSVEREAVRADHVQWSQATFGNVGPIGPLKHLSKEALEAAAAPDDLSEWADMQFLLWDAQRRAGITDEQITQAMVEKLAVNKKREWPAPKDGEPRLHIAAPAVQAEPLSVTDAEHVASVLEMIGSFEPDDIDSDSVDLRFELDGVDTGSDVSITEYATRGAAIIRQLSGNTEQVSQPYTLPLDYLQGYKHGCEWSALMAEANHPQTGDWLFDDPIELAKAIRKGPDMLPAEPGNSPVIQDGWTGSDKANAALVMLDRIDTVDPVDDDRIEGIKRIIRELAAAPKQEAE